MPKGVLHAVVRPQNLLSAIEVNDVAELRPGCWLANDKWSARVPILGGDD